MHQVLATQLEEALSNAPHTAGVAAERALRVAAAMVARGTADVQSTTVVLSVGADDRARIEELVRSLADAYGLAAEIPRRSSTTSVRFRWR